MAEGSKARDRRSSQEAAYLSTQQAAKHLDVCEKTVRRNCSPPSVALVSQR
jgi:hypothetical protein